MERSLVLRETLQRALTVLFRRKKRDSLGKPEWPILLPNMQMELGQLGSVRACVEDTEDNGPGNRKGNRETWGEYSTVQQKFL